MEKPRVSILLPTYNRAEALLRESIQCVLAQKYTNWELIILDDCSTDDTSSICKQFSQENPKVKYHRNSIRKGLPGNRNVGINLSIGELVFFIEDDLLLDDTCLEELVKAYDELAGADKVGGIAPRLIAENMKPLPNHPPFFFNRFTGEIYNNYTIDSNQIVKVPIIHACSLYKKEAIAEVGGYAEEVYKGNYKHEETDLNLRLGKLGYTFYFQPKAKATHVRVMYGGCRTDSKVTEGYYIARNHIIFCMRNFGTKTIYMIPLYLFKFSYDVLRFLFRVP